MGEEKFVGYFRLVEACDEPGCPVCRCLSRESRSYLDALLYEQVTDPDTRRAIRASWGFCNWHTWMLLEIKDSIFGASIIYEDLIKEAIERTKHVGDGANGGRRGWFSALRHRSRASTLVNLYRSRAICPACANAAETEKRYLETLVGFIDDGDLKAAYVRSEGLCLPHLCFALDQNAGRPEARMLGDRTREKWRKLGQEINSFVSKHDYRNREPYTAAEAASYTRAFEMLAGAKNLFGNDLHPRLPTQSRTLVPRAATRRSEDDRVPPRAVGEQAS